MKRILPLLLCAVLLACVPTPQNEFVVNKADGVTESRIRETAAPQSGNGASPGTAREPAFPARWETAFDTSGGGAVTVNAAIGQRQDGVYPVIRTRKTEIRRDDAIRISTALLPAPLGVTTDEGTKAERIEAFKAFLAEIDAQRAGMWHDDTYWTDEEVEEASNRFAAEIAAAPEETPITPAADYRGIEKGTSVWLLPDGGRATVTWTADGFSLVRDGSWVYAEPWQQEDRRLGEPLADVWQPVTTDRAEAEQTALQTLEKLGYTDFSVCAAYPANLLQSGAVPQSKATGWQFVLRRAFGYPVTPNLSPSALFDDGTDYAARIGEESAELFVTANGVYAFGYYAPKLVVGVENANVALLPFDEITQHAEQALSAALSGEGRAHAIFAEVYRVELTVYTVRERNGTDWLEIPCWAFWFDTHGLSDALRRSVTVQHDVLLLNAIDGSVVHGA